MAAVMARKVTRKKTEYYVNNKEFLAALIKYREDVEIAKLRDRPKPVIPRYIGDKIQHDIIDVSRHIKLHRRLSYQSMVYELEVNGSEEIYFYIDFTDSKNIVFIESKGPPFFFLKTRTKGCGRSFAAATTYDII